MSQAAALAALLMLVAGLLVLGRVSFLNPYVGLLLHEHFVAMLTFVLVLFLNLTAGFYLISRMVLLQHIGRKLRHVDRQLKTDDAVLRDLQQRLREDDDESES